MNMYQMLSGVMSQLKDIQDPDTEFYTERDIVCFLQKGLNIKLKEVSGGQNVIVCHEYHMRIPSNGGDEKSIYIDLAVLDEMESPLMVIEVKFEPKHRIEKCFVGKYPVISENGIKKDISRLEHIKSQFPEVECVFVFVTLNKTIESELPSIISQRSNKNVQPMPAGLYCLILSTLHTI